MRSNEFVKKFGIEKAKLLLSTQGKTIAELKGEYTAKQLREYQGYIVSGDLMSFMDLKRLIDSHELVESFGGLEMAKESLKNLPSEYQSYTMTRDDTGATTQSFKLKQAIADVESCQ